MKGFEKKLFEAVKELREMSAEAGPQGWKIKVGNKTFTPAQLDGESKKAFEEIRSYLKKDGFMSNIRKEEKDPADVVFKSGGEAEVYDESGKLLKRYKLKNKVKV
ncbi:MAG: hypothetical protein ACOC1X_03175 [Promethearchaeota archaeon]